MLVFTVVLEGDGFLKGFPKDKVIFLENEITVNTLPGEMRSGLPSLNFIFDLPGGKKVVAQTSVKLFLEAAAIIQAKYRDKFGFIWK